MEAHDLQKPARAMRRALLCFVLAPAERILALWFLELTLEVGQTELLVPRLQLLEDLTGLSRGEISRSLCALKRQRLLQDLPGEGGRVYRLLPDSVNWQARPFGAHHKREAAAAALLSASGASQLELLKPARSLQDAIAETSLEGCCQMTTPLPPGNTSGVVKRQHPWRFDSPDPPQEIESAPVDRVLSNGNTQGVVKRQHLASPPHTPPLEVQGLEALNVQLLRKGGVEGNQSVVARQHLCQRRERVAALILRCAEVLGPETMATYGGGWRLRAWHDPDLLERVLNQVAEMKREGSIHTHAGAAAFDLWKRWGGPSTIPNSKGISLEDGAQAGAESAGERA